MTGMLVKIFKDYSELSVQIDFKVIFTQTIQVRLQMYTVHISTSTLRIVLQKKSKWQV